MSADEQSKTSADDITFDDVFEAELKHVQARWDTAYPDERRAERSVAARSVATTEHDLVGLGMSGGGIRSATFNLGVIQSLVRRGVFDHIDYMSTVSGGGYLGSAISAGMARKGAEFPYPHVSGPIEDHGVTWLRNNSNYMVSKGFIDWLRIAAVLVRGILLNVLVLVPLLIAAALLLFWMSRDLLLDWQAHGIDHGENFRLTYWLALGTLAYFVAYAPITTLLQLLFIGKAPGTGPTSSLSARNRYELSHAWLMLALIVVAVLEALPVLLHGYHAMLASDTVDRDLLTILSCVGSVVSGIKVGEMSAKVSSLLKTLMLYGLGLLGLILPLVVVLIVAENLIYSEGLLYEISSALNLHIVLMTVGIMVVVWLFCHLFIDINLTSIHGLYRDRLATAYRVGKHPDRDQHHPGDPLGPVNRDLPFSHLCAPGSSAPYHLVNTTLNLQGSDDPNIRERLASHFILSKEYAGGEHSGYVLTRDLEEVHPQLDLAVGMAISAAAASPNMGSYTVPSLTALMVLLNVRLGYWLPNPAALTRWAARKKRPWLDSDHRASGQLIRSLSWSLPPRTLISEMLGRVHDKGRFVNLSDGGHIENLGAIELLRRRARYIIIGDGEADPKHEFRGLAVLMRQARLDLGIEMVIDLADVRLSGNSSGSSDSDSGGGISKAHCALGRIVYPARAPDEKSEDGWFIYIKLSLTGDESEIIRQYGAENPDFPHQSTADQFFDEGQFEAYRALGFHAAEQLFAPLQADAGPQTMTFGELRQWFMRLMPKKPTSTAGEAAVHPSDPGAELRYLEMQPQGPLVFDGDDRNDRDDPEDAG